MKELLQKLLETEVLTEDTVANLEEAFQVQLTAALDEAKAEATADVTAELTERYVADREALVEAVEMQVSDFVDVELKELKDDIEAFRDLEVEAADKLVEAKSEMATELKADLVDLVEQLDTFLEMRLTTELDELREDIHEVQKNEFGRKLYEAMSEEFTANFADEDSAASTLAETKQQLADTEAALYEAEAKRAAVERTLKMDEVLSPLSGREKEVMEQILKTVDTSKLDEGYKMFIGRVMVEAAEDTSEKETKVLAENATVEDGAAPVVEGTIVTGDDVDRLVTEGQEGDDGSAERIAHIRKLAGL